MNTQKTTPATKDGRLTFNVLRHRCTDGAIYAQILDHDLFTLKRTWKAAKEALRAKVAEYVKFAQEHKHHDGRRPVIVCKDFTVILVQPSGDGNWEYRITKRDYLRPSFCLGFQTKEKATEKARDHAHQCFNGINYEATI